MFTHVWYSPYMSCCFVFCFFTLISSTVSSTYCLHWAVFNWYLTMNVHSSEYNYRLVIIIIYCTDIEFQSLRTSNVWLSWFEWYCVIVSLMGCGEDMAKTVWLCHSGDKPCLVFTVWKGNIADEKPEIAPQKGSNWKKDEGSHNRNHHRLDWNCAYRFCAHSNSLFSHADKTIQKRQTLLSRFKQCAQLMAPYL